MCFSLHLKLYLKLFLWTSQLIWFLPLISGCYQNLIPLYDEGNKRYINCNLWNGDKCPQGATCQLASRAWVHTIGLDKYTVHYLCCVDGSLQEPVINTAQEKTSDLLHKIASNGNRTGYDYRTTGSPSIPTPQPFPIDQQIVNHSERPLMNNRPPAYGGYTPRSPHSPEIIPNPAQPAPRPVGGRPLPAPPLFPNPDNMPNPKPFPTDSMPNPPPFPLIRQPPQTPLPIPLPPPFIFPASQPPQTAPPPIPQPPTLPPQPTPGTPPQPLPSPPPLPRTIVPPRPPPSAPGTAPTQYQTETRLFPLLYGEVTNRSADGLYRYTGSVTLVQDDGFNILVDSGSAISRMFLIAGTVMHRV